MPNFLETPNGTIAYVKTEGSTPGVIFLGGYASDMTGTKATFLEEKCRAVGASFLRFDYRAHGQSPGDFLQMTISDWLADSLAVLDHLTSGPQILVGSSMGGWLQLLVALKRPERIAGLVGIAAAPDFTERLVWEMMTPEQQNEMTTKGVWREPSQYVEQGLPFTKKLIEDGRTHLLLDSEIKLSAPYIMLQGTADLDVPVRHAQLMLERISAPDAHLHLIKGGDHRLSAPQNLEMLWTMVNALRQKPLL